MDYQPPYRIPEVLLLHAEGLSCSQIASRFGISGSRVGQIIKGERQRALDAAHAMAIRNELRVANDIDRKLPVDDLIHVMELPKRHRTLLAAYFADQGITCYSLRNMMDFLVPRVDDQGDFYDHLPAYRIKRLGQILYGGMIKALSGADCGEAFRQEWTDRKDRLRRYLVGTKGYYPAILHGKHAALLKPA